MMPKTSVINTAPYLRVLCFRVQCEDAINTKYLGSQGAHGSLPVLVLRPVALAEGHETRREVREANSTVGGVHVLPPGSLSPHSVHLQILGGNFNRGGCPCRTTNAREQQTLRLKDGTSCSRNRLPCDVAQRILLSVVNNGQTLPQRIIPCLCYQHCFIEPKTRACHERETPPVTRGIYFP